MADGKLLYLSNELTSQSREKQIRKLLINSTVIFHRKSRYKVDAPAFCGSIIHSWNQEFEQGKVLLVTFFSRQKASIFVGRFL